MIKAKKDSLPPLLLWYCAVIISLFGEKVLEVQTDSTAAVTAAVAIRCAAAIFIPAGTYYVYRSLKKDGESRYVFAAAIALELFYDLILTEKLFDSERQNPLFALCICCVMAYFFESYGKKKAVLFLVGAFGILWAVILRADWGVPVTVSFFIIAMTKKRCRTRPLVLAAALSLCTLQSPFCALSPLGALWIKDEGE